MGISATASSGATPFHLGLFFLQIPGVDLPDRGETSEDVVAVLLSLVTNPWIAGALVFGLVALALTALDTPHWFALINNVNIPEHWGTTFGLGNLKFSVSRSLGNYVTGLTFAYLATLYIEPLKFVLGLALFQIFFLPTAFFYYRTTKTTTRDISQVKATLASRAMATKPPSRESTQTASTAW